MLLLLPPNLRVVAIGHLSFGEGSVFHMDQDSNRAFYIHIRKL